MNYLWFLIIGAIAGWLGNRIMKISGKNAWINFVCGIAGGIAGDIILRILCVPYYGILGGLISACVGAILFIWILSRIRGNHQSDEEQKDGTDENSSFKVAEDGTIIRVSGTRTCPKCNKSFPIEARFCSACGAKLK